MRLGGSAKVIGPRGVDTVSREARRRGQPRPLVGASNALTSAGCPCQMEREAQAAVDLPCSTLERDLAEASAASGCSGGGSSRVSATESAAPSPATAGTTPPLGGPDCAIVGEGWSLPAHKALLKGDPARARPPPCWLRLPSKAPLAGGHRPPGVLRPARLPGSLTGRRLLAVRSQHFRARFDSGMRDADRDQLTVPESFSKVGKRRCKCPRCLP